MRKTRLTAALLLAVCLFLIPLGALAGETDGDCLYTMLNSGGQVVARRAGRMYVGDEYISGDNRLYRVTAVDTAHETAFAEDLGEATIDEAALSAFQSLTSRAEATEKPDGKKLICMYSTHSDESYVPDDGDFSLWQGAGIYDVGNALKDELEALGVKVVYSEESFLPHDADAYNRSRSTAEELLKKGPDALLDIHRDAIPAEEYETEVDGEDVSKVRLFVGRSNQNSAANKAFAQQLKKLADEEYPGLIKDIYIGKGNYNQELYPQALLLEFGTDEIEKDKAIGATKYMASVLNQALYGASAKASGGAKNASAFAGIGWVVGLAVLAAVVYAMISTGKLGPAWEKLKRGTSEITGGLFGKKPDGKD